MRAFLLCTAAAASHRETRRQLSVDANGQLEEVWLDAPEWQANLRTGPRITDFASIEPLGYHRYASIWKAAKELEQPCAKAGLTLTSWTVDGREDVHIDVVKLTPTGTSAGRVSAVFGEHPRELISPETGLTMLQALCDAVEPCDKCKKSKEHDAVAEQLAHQAEAMRGHEWLVVLNSNPNTRAKLEAESGFCLREDPDGVDTNRNYDDHFDSVDDHGSSPFSAPEAEILSKVMDDFKPQVFFSIHSGETGLYTPHAWSTQDPGNTPENKALAQMKAEGFLPAGYTIGSAGHLQGREITGSSFDYVKDKLGAEYSYAFELYKDGSVYPTDEATCFAFFNPQDLDTTVLTRERMSAVILSTAKKSKLD